MESYADLLRRKRKEAGLTQIQLADKVATHGVNVTNGYISTLEREYDAHNNGKIVRPNEKIVETIAKVLDWDIDDARLSAGYAPTNPLRKPQTAAEFIEALESLGVDGINLYGSTQNLTPDEYAALLRDVSIAVEMNLRRAGKV